MPYPRAFLAQPATQAPSPRSDSEQTTVVLVTWFQLPAFIPEVVSAFPTCGELYTALYQFCPKSLLAIVGWIVGQLDILGQVVRSFF